MINLFIADDHAMMREGIKRMIAGSKDLKVIGEAVDGDEVIQKIGHTPCDVLMLDMAMPGIAGLELITQVKALKSDLPILVLSMHNVGKIVGAALKAGADGYLTKDSDPDRLVDVLRKIARGEKYIDPAIAETLIFGNANAKLPHEALSGREHEVFMQIIEGKATKLIANELLLSAKTVSTYKKRIFEKMNMKNTASLVRYAIEHELLPSPR